jgi:hypothetical protein
MKNNVIQTICLGFVCAGLTGGVQAALIASESFKTTADVNDYTSGTAVANVVNRSIVTGNSGFGAFTWLNETGVIKPTSASSLTHNGLTGTAQSGAMQISLSGVLSRNSNRSLSSSPVLSGSYFLSGLVNLSALTDLRDGDYVAAGFMESIANSTADISSGIHLGVSRAGGIAYLSAFAGGSTYNLLALDGSSYGKTFQIVLQLDAADGSADTLNAWYAADGDTQLTHALTDASIETWTSADSLKRLVLQSKSGTTTLNGAYVDELRLGTALSDVTTIPEPTSVSLLVVSTVGLFLARRMIG